MIWTKSPFVGPMSIFRGVSIYVGVIDSKQDTAGRISWCPWHSWVRFVKSCVILDFDSLRWHCCYNPSLACGMICWMHGLRSPQCLVFLTEWMMGERRKRMKLYYEQIFWTHTWKYEELASSQWWNARSGAPRDKDLTWRFGTVGKHTWSHVTWWWWKEVASSLVSGIQCER